MELDQATLQDLFDRAMAINQEAFSAGQFDAAYHALMTAYHLAELLEPDEPLLAVSKAAAEQISWIDRHHPEYDHSTRSATMRHLGSTIFHNLSTQAQVRIRLRKVKRKRKPGQEMD